MLRSLQPLIPRLRRGKRNLLQATSAGQGRASPPAIRGVKVSLPQATEEPQEGEDIMPLSLSRFIAWLAGLSDPHV